MDNVTICNLALAKCGEQRIVSLTEKSKNAVLCNLHYDEVRRRVLRAHPWNCAMARATLGALSEVPLFDWDLQYELPVDCLRVFRLDGYEMYKVEGRHLLTNISPCQILYIRDLVDPNLFDPLLIKVITLELAVELSYNLTEVATHSERLIEESRMAWVEARSADAQEGTPEPHKDSGWLDARVIGTTPFLTDPAFRKIEPGT
jgi:hypothetical protein